MVVTQGWFDLATSSEEQENTLRLPDLGTICLGYMVMSAMVFMWRGIINAISDRINTQVLLRAKKAMRVIAAVVKVGTKSERRFDACLFCFVCVHDICR